MFRFRRSLRPILGPNAFLIFLSMGCEFTVPQELPATARQGPSLSAPRDVTAQTLSNPAALAALEAPGVMIFADDFESQLSLSNYFEIRGLDAGRVVLMQDADYAHTGLGAIQFTAPAVASGPSSSGASGWLGADGYSTVYFRRYIRFAPDYDQGALHHTGGGMAAVAGTSMWAEMGRSGVRPNGDDRFTCHFEPYLDWGRIPLPGYMMFYTYWVDMEQASDGRWWGNSLAPVEAARVVPPRGVWVCLEQMIRVNDIGRANGELAGWIDGRLYVHMTGFRWRTSEDVRIKRFDIGIYIHEAQRTNTVWYDDVVLSTGYVGTTQMSR